MSIEEYGYEEFDILEENWSEYHLSDSSIMKTRLILQKLFKTVQDGSGSITYGFNSSNLISVMCPKSLRGSASITAYTPQELNASIVEDDLHYETIKENWNRYRLRNETVISLKLALVKISRTGKFDNKGEPIYLVNTQPLMKANLPKSLREKTVKFSSTNPPYFTV
ncbi:MAG: hypothetical protein ACE5KO_04220 [Candidatus Bathyarchaeia archaeon]